MEAGGNGKDRVANLFINKLAAKLRKKATGFAIDQDNSLVEDEMAAQEELDSE
jgi:hypothetical protein